jgi:hypothetical protein
VLPGITNPPLYSPELSLASAETVPREAVLRMRAAARAAFVLVNMANLQIVQPFEIREALTR